MVVGHTDTTGAPIVNDPLSLERTKATLAYLEDDVDTWLTFYGTSVPAERRWSEPEDASMQKLVGDSSLTRAELIAKYMALDGVKLDAQEFSIKGSAHGCGENFPLDDTGERLDTAPEDGKADALDRRVELFFFDPEFGIVPKPAGENSRKGSKQYPEWRKLAKLVSEQEVLGPGTCHLAYVVHNSSGTVLANTAFTVTLPTGPFSSTTTGDGLLSVRGLEPDQFSVRITNLEIVLASFDQREQTRLVEVLPPTQGPAGSGT